MAENWDSEDAPAVGGGAAVAVAELPEVKLFGKWSTDDVQVSDISLTVRCALFSRL
jgi:small subunit ribosomal protein S5e